MSTLIKLSPAISVFVALAGFLWGVYQYGIQQRENRSAQHKESIAQREAMERQFMRPWMESQREVYMRALAAASTAANAEDEKLRQSAETEFWSLYHGQMILVETTEVSNKMVDFGKCLGGEEFCDREKKNALSKILATTMAKSMAETGNMKFEEFAARQFKYEKSE